MTAQIEIVEPEAVARAHEDGVVDTRLPLRLLESRTLRGGNVHHVSTVFRQRVDLGGFVDAFTAEAGPEFARGFVERFVGLEKPTPNGHMTEDFLARLNGPAGVPLAAALFEAILAVELSAGFLMRRPAALEYAEIVRREGRHTIDFVWQCHLPGVSRAAVETGFAGFYELLPDRLRSPVSAPARSFAAALAALRRRAARLRWSTTAAALAQAARQRGLPCEPLGDAYLLLGQGVAQHVVYASAAGESSPDRRAADGTALEVRFPAGTSATIPVALIAGRRGTQLIARELEGILRATGKAVGLATGRHTRISGEPVEQGSLGLRDGALLLLHDPRVEVLVAATSPRRIVQRGLRIDRCTAAAVVDADADFDAAPSRLAFEVVARATSGAVIVDAGSAAAALLPFEPRRVVLLSSGQDLASSEQQPLPMRRHLEGGGSVVQRVAHAEGHRIELYRGGEAVWSVPISAPGSGTIRDRERRLRARMFAVALADALGVSGGEIATAARRWMSLRG